MKKLLFVALLLSVSAAAHAEINVVDSLEWMSVDSPLIIRAKVIAAADTAGPYAVIYRDITVQIQEVLKGPVTADTIKIRLRLFKGDTQGLTWKKSGHPILFFLSKGSENDDKALVGWWTLREKRQSVIDLERPEWVYKADMQHAEDAENILSIVRKWAAWKKDLPEVGAPNILKPQAGYVRLEIPPGADIYPSVYAGSACYINVPAEQKYRSLALSKARSASQSQRIQGAQMLRNYPGSKTVQILRMLLYDESRQDWFNGPDQLVKITYDVRRAAYESLLALGQKPPKPVLERYPTPEEIQNARYQYWERRVWKCLPEGWVVCSIWDADNPTGWTRTAGEKGIAIESLRLTTQPADNHQRGRSAFTLYVMPAGWQGCNAAYPQERLVDGKYTPLPKEPFPNRSLRATYLGHDGDRHFFCSATAPATWPDAYKQLRRCFSLQINMSQLVWAD